MAGRPTKYNEKMLKKTQHYVENFAEYKDAVPSVEGLAIVLDIDKTTLYDWCDRCEHFSHTFKKLKEAQARIIMNNGLTGKFNPTISKLMLSNHGYHEKQQVEQTKPTTQIIVNNTKDAEALGDLDDTE